MIPAGLSHFGKLKKFAGQIVTVIGSPFEALKQNGGMAFAYCTGGRKYRHPPTAMCMGLSLIQFFLICLH
jgi:hypothetical protein